MAKNYGMTKGAKPPTKKKGGKKKSKKMMTKGLFAKKMST